MKLLYLAMTVLLIGFSFFAGTALAEEEEKKGIFDVDNFSATLSLTTDYVFRGISQTDSEPAVQGSFDYNHPVGIYLGIWGSNVNSGISSGGVEFDLYAGFARELFTNFNADVGFYYYAYPGGGSNPEPDYYELTLGLHYIFANLPLSPKLGASYWYSPDFFGEDGDAHYINGLLELALPYEFVLSGELGYQDVEGDKTTGNNQGEGGKDGFDYTHWRIGISRIFCGNEESGLKTSPDVWWLTPRHALCEKQVDYP